MGAVTFFFTFGEIIFVDERFVIEAGSVWSAGARAGGVWTAGPVLASVWSAGGVAGSVKPQ